VLSTPPAFILSQDQTLRCRANPLAQLSPHSVHFALSQTAFEVSDMPLPDRRFRERMI
jgi:hypothetical protein